VPSVAGQPPSGASIRVAGTADLPAIAALSYEVAPEMALTAEELAHEDTLTPGGRRFVAEVDSALAGLGVAGIFYSREPEFEGSWTTLQVREPFRRRGIGGALLARVADHAAVLGKGSLHMWTSEARPEVAPWLARRGFAEHERAKYVALSLVGLEPPAVDPPAGVEITTLAERPDLLRALHAVADATAHDIPGQDEPHTAGTFEEFVAYDVDGPQSRREAIFIALAGDEVAGYASLGFPGAYPTLAWHDMTGVMPAFRGRGIAGALKRAAVVWAAANGIDTLETENNVENAPMRAINLALGYQPQPDEVIMRGPLSSE
jgi:GNAT superfamily N-acetyltransferase